ncbi:glycosyltransferase family 4 protein [Vibrio breoganii]
MKLIVLGALPSSLVNFRGELIKRLCLNHEVITVASNANTNDIESISLLGCKYIDCPISRNGLNPVDDLKTCFSLFRLFNKESNDVLLAYTIKPVIWGGIASRFTNVKSFYAMITGLGYAFQKGNLAKTVLNKVVKFLYKLALKESKAVIFQNSENMDLFIKEGIISRDKCFLVNGSGVNTNHYRKSPLPPTPHFLLIARLLGDKGVREYAKAAEIVKRSYPESIFELVGPEDSSPDRISLDEIREWCDTGSIIYGGATNDVRPYIDRCAVYVLPSYHEGMPRTVLEAMAMGRPILTTDVPGCRETVENGVNGWLVEKANVEQLAERMIWFIENEEQWPVMGKKSCEMASEKFDVHKVNAEILNIMGLADEKAI